MNVTMHGGPVFCRCSPNPQGDSRPRHAVLVPSYHNQLSPLHAGVPVAVNYEVHACGFHIGGGATCTRHLVYSL